MGLTIVGGIYLEQSVFPSREVLYGSGARAAAVLRNLNPERTLVSFVGDDRRESIEYHAKKVWHTPLTPHRVPHTVSFQYYHGLSTPVIRPSRLPFSSAPLIEVTGDAILQFGMLEGNAIVHGKRVVFDPQNPESPLLFHNIGSTAEEIAYVLNRNEARKLAETDNLDIAGAKLLGEEKVSVVVIKSGADGAFVFSHDGKWNIPAYETNYIWPIGSGDVFAAIFAHFWASQQLPPEKAADYASRGVAIYCSGNGSPLDESELRGEDFKFPVLAPKKSPKDVTVYIAGPFFTMGQLWLVEEARNALSAAGFRVFSPFHDVGLGDAARVVPKDLDGIMDADVVLALCDGLDSGTLFEVGYAVKAGKSVVAFGEQTSDESMKMLVGSGCKVFRDFTTAIYHTHWEALK